MPGIYFINYICIFWSTLFTKGACYLFSVNYYCCLFYWSPLRVNTEHIHLLRKLIMAYSCLPLALSYKKHFTTHALLFLCRLYRLLWPCIQHALSIWQPSEWSQHHRWMPTPCSGMSTYIAVGYNFKTASSDARCFIYKDKARMHELNVQQNEGDTYRHITGCQLGKEAGCHSQQCQTFILR